MKIRRLGHACFLITAEYGHWSTLCKLTARGKMGIMADI